MNKIIKLTIHFSSVFTLALLVFFGGLLSKLAKTDSGALGFSTFMGFENIASADIPAGVNPNGGTLNPDGSYSGDWSYTDDCDGGGSGSGGSGGC